MSTSTEVVKSWGQTLDQIKAGESVEVTAHGRPVARIEPPRRYRPGRDVAAWMLQKRPDPELADYLQAGVDAARQERNETAP